MTITARLSDWYWNLSRLKKWIAKGAVFLLAVGIYVYVVFMPPKSVPMVLPIAQGSPLATEATENWWTVFHADSIEALPAVLDQLTAAHETSPPDPVLSSILAGAHLWRFITRARTELTEAEVIESLEAARRYSEEAVRLDPVNDTATAPSIVSVAEWPLNVLKGTPEANTDVHIDILERSIENPRFAGFIQGWLLGAMFHPDDRYFGQAEVGFNLVLEACASPLPIPEPPRFNKLIHTLFAIRVWNAPVCYEDVAATHNIEGMFFGMGDAWLKAGDIDRARLWYENVKTGPNYESWKYKEYLQARLDSLDTYRKRFLDESGMIMGVTEPAMQFQSEISCGVCHTR